MKNLLGSSISKLYVKRNIPWPYYHENQQNKIFKIKDEQDTQPTVYTPPIPYYLLYNRVGPFF